MADIDNYMKIENVIVDIEKEIFFQESIISKLNNKKLKFQKIKEQFPNAQFESGNLCIDGLWEKASCMRIEYKNQYYSTSKINVKFLLGKKNSYDDMKIYTRPLENPIAEIKTSYGLKKKKEILIFDYKSIIPIECPKRNSFIKRIKIYIINRISIDKLSIMAGSFNIDEFSKLMMLK